MSAYGPPNTLTITDQRERGRGEPSGRSNTARRWFSNWLVTAPSMLQCPVLWGRIASSLTRMRPSTVSNSSTARTPTTSSAPAISNAICWASSARGSARSGAGAMTSWHTPSRWTDSTTGYAIAWPDGDRATRADSSRAKSTRSSTITGTPAPRTGGDFAGGAVDEPDALAVVATSGRLRGRPASHRSRRPRPRDLAHR